MLMPPPLLIKALEKHSAPVLIVDDDQATQAAVSKHLKANGYNVLLAATPEDALEQLRKQNISIIITYHKLNGTSGVDLLIKSREIKPGTERILFGADTIPEHILELIHPVMVMAHPQENASLLQVVNDCFERFRVRFEHESMNTLLQNHHTALAEAQGKINNELKIGNKIHHSLLLDPLPKNLPGVSLSLISCVSTEIDGDFVAFFRPQSEIIDIVLGDVMGKGLPSALIGTAIKAELARVATPPKHSNFAYDNENSWREDIPEIRDVIQEVHSNFVERLVSLEYYVSLIYCRVDLHKRRFSFIDCGFTKPLYYRKAARKAIAISSPNFPIGTVQHHEYSPFEINYDEGDFFILYSDGITEAKSKSGELFGEQRLSQLIEKYSDLAPEPLSKKIQQEVQQYSGEKLNEDDFTLLVFKIDKYTAIQPNRPGVSKFNSVLTQLDAVRKLTREYCRQAPGDADRTSTELQLAMDEIFTNIVLHGYENKPGLPICIRAEYASDHLMIEISDQGRSFHPTYIPEINLYGDKDHGYGWYLIQRIVDKVEYVPKKSQNGWNHLRIYKNYQKQGSPMELTATEKGETLVIRLDSETLDAKQVPEFKEKVLKIIDQKQPDNVVFDMQNLQFIDSSGLGAFLSLLRQLNARGGHLRIASMGKSVKAIFELVSMQKIFECSDTIDQAIQSYAAKKLQNK